MTSETLKQKALEIADQLFSSPDQALSSEQFRDILGDELLGYGGIIKDGLCSTPKIVKSQGRSGGIKMKIERYQRPELSGTEKKLIGQTIELLLSEFNKQNEKPKREKPEKEVQDGFALWLKDVQLSNQNSSSSKVTGFQIELLFTDFRSDARKGVKWENVDGYSLSVETSKYHIHFKPILTTFEVKATLPKKEDIRQAEEYLKFSHFVYLVFNSGNSDNASIKDSLKKFGFDEHKGIGVYYTQDNKTFLTLYEAKRNAPTEDDVDKKIDILLADDHKVSLRKARIKYTIDSILIPAIEMS